MATPAVVTLDAMHDAIIATLRAAFGDRVRQYGAYSPLGEFDDEEPASLETPALLLELESFDLAADGKADPWGRIPLRCVWIVRCILSIQTTRLQQELPQFAAAAAAIVAAPDDPTKRVIGTTWGLGCGVVERADVISAQPAEFEPGLHGRDSWLVRWEQIVFASSELPA